MANETIFSIKFLNYEKTVTSIDEVVTGLSDMKEELSKLGYQFKDYGTYSLDSCDYSDFIHPLAKDINDGVYQRGLIMCGSGNGVQMTANKYLKVR